MTCSIVRVSQVNPSQVRPAQLHQSNNSTLNNDIVQIRMQNVMSMIRFFRHSSSFSFFIVLRKKKVPFDIEYWATCICKNATFVLYYMLHAFPSSFTSFSRSLSQTHYLIASLLYLHALTLARTSHCQMRIAHTHAQLFLKLWFAHTSISMQMW